MSRTRRAALLVLAVLLVLPGSRRPAARQAAADPAPQVFRSGVELVNVTVTVSDPRGRFVSGLRQDDFVVLEDGVPQEVSYFAAERVPVSLGLAIDTSGSMAGERMEAAREALDRFLHRLLGPDDEVFLYRIAERPHLLQSWTRNRDEVGRALRWIVPRGGTALYDTVAEALPLAQEGSRRKRALLVLSDGNDTTSIAGPRELRRLVRERDVLVYAIAIDAPGEETRWPTGGQRPRFPVPRIPTPFPMPGGPPQWPGVPPPDPGPGGGGGRVLNRGAERADIDALRELTDASGGRTEIVRAAADLGPVTTGIADELSRQYFLAYASPQLRDGRWHDIVVRLRGCDDCIVRARRGYLATR
jgi:Ca-activated chloride channel family protein